MKKLLVIFALFTTTITSAQIPNYVPTNGLVGWWPFNGNANDESGNGHTGIVNGAILSIDRYGSANSSYEFDGINNKITVDSLSSLDSIWTISFWFNSSDNGMFAIQNIIGLGSSTSAFGGAGYVINGGISPGQCPIFNNNLNKMLLSDASSECGQLIFSNNYINNNWYHITISNNNGNFKIYVNSTLSVSNSINNIKINKLFLGIRDGITFQTFKGNIDDVCVWNRALAQQEITRLYAGCSSSINLQPQNQNKKTGESTEFIVKSNDTLASYNWQTDIGLGFQNISNAGQYSGANNDTLKINNLNPFNNNQKFRCIVTSTNACVDTTNVVTLYIDNSTSINNSINSNIKIYPNPTSDIINIEELSSNEEILVNIYDVRGKLILSNEIREQGIIDISELNNGIYILKVGDIIQRVIKM